MPRFVCLSCRRSFSRQSFATSYYLKRPELLVGVAACLQAGCAHRQIARTLRCAPSTVTRLASRLGRHCLLMTSRALGELRGRLDEPVVFDHFESFEFSQDLPVAVATPVGSRSWFVYGVDAATHRRSGRLSAQQAARVKSRPARPTLGGYTGSTRRALDVLVQLLGEGKRLHLVADAHPAYARAVSRHRQRARIHLRRYANPPRGRKGSARSAAGRARDRALFASDLLHALWRHSLAHHRRETIAFARRANALMERMFVALVWRNFVKHRSERTGQPVTPAMWVGLSEAPWGWPRVLARRLFASREKVPRLWERIYRKEWTSPVLETNARHRLVRAY